VNGPGVKTAPLLVPAVALLTGVLAEAYGLPFVALIAAVALLLLRRDACAGLACGVLIAAVHGHPFAVERESRTARYTGTVTGDVRREDAFSTFPFAVDGFVTLRATSRERVRAGERLALSPNVRPFDETPNPAEPSARPLGLDHCIAGPPHVDRIFQRRPPDLPHLRVWAPPLPQRPPPVIASPRSARPFGIARLTATWSPRPRPRSRSPGWCNHQQPSETLLYRTLPNIRTM